MARISGYLVISIFVFYLFVIISTKPESLDSTANSRVINQKQATYLWKRKTCKSYTLDNYLLRKKNVNRMRTCKINYKKNVFISEYGGFPWRVSNKIYSNGILGLHEEIQDFYTFINPSKEEHYLRLQVVKKMYKLIYNLWPESKVEIFGSFRTGLYLPQSDIDLVVIGNWTDLPLRILEGALLEQKITKPHLIKVLNKARVPIIKFTDKKTKIEVDISFNMNDAPKSAEWIKTLKKKFPILDKLVLVLKQFVFQRHLNKAFTGGISSYSLVLMTISFLQLHPRQEAISTNANLGLLLIEFLDLYGRKFDYIKTGIILKDGGGYISKDEIQRNMINGHKPSLLYIEDPVTFGKETAGSSFNILDVKDAFEWAYLELVQAITFPHTPINQTNTSSILGRIIQVNNDVIHYRKWIKDSFPFLLGIDLSSKIDTLKTFKTTSKDMDRKKNCGDSSIVKSKNNERNLDKDESFIGERITFFHWALTNLFFLSNKIPKSFCYAV